MSIFCVLVFKLIVFLLVMILIGLSCDSEVLEGNSKFRNNFLDAKRKIHHLQKHALKSIKSEDGDIIDCIDIYKQPAFDHPALKNHTIQMAPTDDPTIETTAKTRSKEKAAVSQLWKENGECPKGTIPIRRTREKDVLKSNSITDYGRKKPQFFNKDVLNGEDKSYVLFANHSMAILLTEGYSYSGGKGDIKVDNPYVELDDEYSTSQVSLKNGPYYNFESVESGWAVNPSVYGDRQTRLFTYWTVDASKETGCFDVTCPGFVQTSNEIALGAAIYPISVSGGLPYEIIIYIFKDPITANWWVQYGESINIGYWPHNLFSLLNQNAASVEWGGEVYSSNIGGVTPHTSTAMGNGKFSDPISQDSGFIRRMRIQANSMALKIPEWVSSYTDEYYCYDTHYLEDYIDDPEFSYGGPGRNERCP